MNDSLLFFLLFFFFYFNLRLYIRLKYILDILILNSKHIKKKVLKFIHSIVYIYIYIKIYTYKEIKIKYSQI